MPRPADDYAPLYSTRERWRLLALWLAFALAVMLPARLWGLPWLQEFGPVAHCRAVFGMPGHVALLYALFVGLPLLTAAVLAATAGQRGLRVLYHAQVPLPGEKVLRPTRIRRDGQARLIGVAHLLPPLLALALAVWGFGQVSVLIRTSPPRPAGCAPGTGVPQGFGTAAAQPGQGHQPRPVRA